MLCSPMGLGFPHSGVPCPVGAPLGRAALELQNWTGVLLILPFQPQGCSQRHCVQHKVLPKICSEDNMLWVEAWQRAGRLGHIQWPGRTAGLWAGYVFPGIFLQLGAAKGKASRLP